MMPLPSAWASPVVPGSCAVRMNARPASAQTAPAASLASRLTRLVRCLLAVDRPCASLMCPLRLLASSPASIPWGASCGPPGRWEAVESNGRLRLRTSTAALLRTPSQTTRYSRVYGWAVQPSERNGWPAWLGICTSMPVSYTHLRAHETRHDLVCRLLLE